VIRLSGSRAVNMKAMVFLSVALMKSPSILLHLAQPAIAPAVLFFLDPGMQCLVFLIRLHMRLTHFLATCR
jgi:hypothetical protein